MWSCSQHMKLDNNCWAVKCGKYFFLLCCPSFNWVYCVRLSFLIAMVLFLLSKAFLIPKE